MCMKEMSENEYIRMMRLVGVEYTEEDMDARCIPTNTTSRKVMEMYSQFIRCYRNKIHTKLHCAQEKMMKLMSCGAFIEYVWTDIPAEAEFNMNCEELRNLPSISDVFYPDSAELTTTIFDE